MTPISRPAVTIEFGATTVVLRPVTRLADAIYAICRDCERRWYRYDGTTRSLSQRIAMHNHSREGEWEKSGGVKRAWLYGMPERTAS